MSAGYTKIYHLRIPGGLPRYVGKTIHTLDNRLARHFKESKDKTHRRANWIKKNQREGVPILIELIEEVEGNGSDRERYWIAEYKARGYDLINATEGGEGVEGLIYSAESRKKMSISHSLVMSTPERREISRRTATRMWMEKTDEEKRAWNLALQEAKRIKALNTPKSDKPRSKQTTMYSGLSQSDITRLIHAGRTPEERSRIARKAAITRAINAEERKRLGIPPPGHRIDRVKLSERVQNQWKGYSPEKKAEICLKISNSRKRGHKNKEKSV